jgi:hypothetical protein
MRRAKSIGVPLLFLAFVEFGCNIKTSNNNGAPSSKDIDGKFLSAGVPVFERTDHNFGNIVPGEEVGARFSFKNEGGSPLTIERVTTGCGCTVAEYSKNPVSPNESGFVEVIFDSRGKFGAQFQEVQVYFQGLERPSCLSIVAQVFKK